VPPFIRRDLKQEGYKMGFFLGLNTWICITIGESKLLIAQEDIKYQTKEHRVSKESALAPL
jgi:hypothetical protein